MSSLLEALPFIGRRFRQRRLERIGQEYAAMMERWLQEKWQHMGGLENSFLTTLSEDLSLLESEGGFTRADTEDCLVEMARGYDEHAPSIAQAMHEHMQPLYDELAVADMADEIRAIIDKRLADFRFNMVAKGVIMQGEFCDRHGLPEHPKWLTESSGEN